MGAATLSNLFSRLVYSTPEMCKTFHHDWPVQLFGLRPCKRENSDAMTSPVLHGAQDVDRLKHKASLLYRVPLQKAPTVPWSIHWLAHLTRLKCILRRVHLFWNPKLHQNKRPLNIICSFQNLSLVRVRAHQTGNHMTTRGKITTLSCY